jgi:hypothetical protein
VNATNIRLQCTLRFITIISQNELWKKYENIINKVKQKEELTDTEALDIAFISKFMLKEHAPSVIESLAKVFKKAIIKDELLKMDVGVILGGMILKHITSNTKQNKMQYCYKLKNCFVK